MILERFFGESQEGGGRSQLEQLKAVIDPIAEEAKMLRIMKEARIDVQRLRKELTDPSPFNNASIAIDRVVDDYKTKESLDQGQVADLYAELNKTYLEPLAEVEAAHGRTDWTVPLQQ